MVKVGKEITKMLSDLQSFKMMALIQVLLTKYNTQFSAMQYNSLSNQNVETFIVLFLLEWFINFAFVHCLW